MSKTLQSLIKEAVDLCDEAGYANTQWVEWLNNGIDDLAPVLYIDKQVTIAGSAGVFPIPTDYLSMIRLDGTTTNLTLLDPSDDTSTGYKVVAGNFVLQNDTSESIKVWYYSTPAYFSTSAITTPIDARLEPAARALVFYACAMGMMFEDESDRYDLYYNMYNNSKIAINQANIKKKAGRGGSWAVVR